MVVGMPSLTPEQNRLHLSLCAMAATPLLIGADLTTLNVATLADLTNPEVIAIDQNPLGLQAVKVAENGPGLEIWSQFLSASGERGVEGSGLDRL
jgi:hypothetical protein